jgi:hypothetical protein
MTWSLSRYRAGDYVEVRSKEEILATLDQHGCVDGMPFMPEMLQYSGQRFRVSAVAHKTCDTVRKTWRARRLQATVHLAGLRCNGSAHGGCQAECNLFWKDVWLKPVGDSASTSAKRAIAVLTAALSQYTETQLLAHTRVVSGANGEEPCYSCQATKLYEATESLHWWDLRQYVRDVVTRNHSLGRVLCVLWLALLRRLLLITPFGYRLLKRFTDGMHLLLTGRPGPGIHGKIADGARTPSNRLDLKPGEFVRIKSQQAIEETLDAKGKNRGLFFDWEMIPYCGRVFKVRSRVSRMIDEPTGKMLELKQPCIMLEGVVCNSVYNSSRLMCPRAIPPYWREEWLDRLNDPRRDQGGSMDDGRAAESAARMATVNGQQPEGTTLCPRAESSAP